MGFFDRLRSAVQRGLRPVSTTIEERALSTVGRRDPGRVITTLPIYLQLQRIPGQLTPQDVSSILRQADIGYMWRYVDLCNELRQKDGHLQSVLQTRELALTGLEWQILPYKTQHQKEAKLRDRKAAEFCAEALRHCTGAVTQEGKPLAGLHQMIAHIVGGHYPGYAVSETIYTKKGKDIVPLGFDNISARRFIHDLEAGVLRWCDITAGMGLPGIDLRKEYPGQFIQFEPRVNGDVPTREGLGRVLVWAALFRNWDTRDWLQLAELAWKPWRTGKYKKEGTEQRDIDGLYTILDNMSANGVAVYPDNVDLEVHWPKGGGKGTSAHKELFDAMGAEMSKATIGQTLTTEQGSKGSQALGRVHNDVRKDILQADARSVGAVIKRDLLTPLVRMNFGADVVVPEFQFVTEDPQDVVAFSQALKNLSGAGSPGVRVPVRHIYEICGIPQPEEDEECVGGAGTVPENEGDAPTDPNDPEENETPDEEPAGDDKPKDDAKDEPKAEEKPKKAPRVSPRSRAASEAVRSAVATKSGVDPKSGLSLPTALLALADALEADARNDQAAE